jgi:hypothetical protein
MMNDYDKRLNATYGGDNDYFLLENGNILEVINGDMSWDELKSFDDFHGIADDFQDMLHQIQKQQTNDEIYNKISRRAIDHYINANEGKFIVENADIPGAANVWNLYDKATGDCLFNDNVYTTDEDSYYDVMAAYFAQEVAQTSISKEVWGYSKYYDDFKELLEYCSDNNIDISDLLEYRELHSHIDRDSHAIAFADLIHAEIAGCEPSKIIDGAVHQLQSYLDGEVYRINEYTIDGEEVDSCGGFLGDDIQTNGIEDNFGKTVEKLGSYEDIEACLEDNQEKLGIEIEPEKPLQDRISRRGDER